MDTHQVRGGVGDNSIVQPLQLYNWVDSDIIQPLQLQLHVQRVQIKRFPRLTRLDGAH